ncbi:SulP family inorganic anion transporter [Paenibacillus apiarius]|uniref:SulP family inorganic anion transporter n=2 Tax=Paenibacillus apiarius TaxID=46240 RepID=A0ABT4DLT7_9BACL|nr:SulP family inorganic anion transporter [Paenibacillus apiarius]MCY9518319.1 SulP family inorganic anion transporter [Paenibacillus apiarius]MCY9551280.1 SulP family inorganic anion transporter [Paenibacillus apiarius]MCY9558434.1 SulP family inorganic anion transporter [Paenibacillus apiarius]MCY9687137.1 SulP family inorganic anion transporter [Paenibacillus apiarius]MCY9721496.1 SulP family inorganic anion transporter [Paenibacillus apiarius]
MKPLLRGRYAGYNAQALKKDIISGSIVGIVAIPLGMAFAIASGVKPEYGLYTTIVAGLLISLLGGSRFQIGGPTGAFIPILFAIVLQYGYDNLLIAGFMAGVMLVLMGLFRLGAVIRFIPRPVTIGFTAGIAVIIFTGQIADFLGLHVEKQDGFISDMRELAVHLPSLNLYSVLTAALCLAVLLLTPKWLPKIPGSLLGLLVSSLAAAWFFPGQVATIGSTFGAIPSGLPAFRIPEISWDRIVQLIQPAFVIAMLGGIESLLSAVVADGMTGDRHRSNRELVGQGLANMITPLFGGIPATGAIARTATNIRNGAVSPVSGVVHAIVVLLVLLFFAPYASNIPLSAMAPILMVVAWNMSERKAFLHILKTRTADSLILSVTFLLTVFANLTVAVQAGLVLAVVLFVKRMSEGVKVAKVLPDPADRKAKVSSRIVKDGRYCPQISMFSVEGPLFFGAAHSFEQSLTDQFGDMPLVLILRLGRVPYMDTTAESNLSALVSRVHRQGGMVLVTGIHDQPRMVMQKTGLAARIGSEHFFERTGAAIDFALTRISAARCQGCRHFAFRECDALSGVHALPEHKLAAPKPDTVQA